MKINNKLSYGFTIVELLIAMTGFSFILLLVTVVMINIGNIYGKGINQTKLDDAARYISSDLSRQLKYNKVSNFNSSITDATSAIKAYCIGNSKYTYILGYRAGDRYGSGNLKHVILKTSIPPGESDCNPENMYTTSEGEELMPKNSSVSFFEVSNTGFQYTISIALAYGDKLRMDNYGGMNVKCDSVNNYYNCAVSSLTTVVSARLN